MCVCSQVYIYAIGERNKEYILEKKKLYIVVYPQFLLDLVQSIALQNVI